VNLMSSLFFVRRIGSGGNLGPVGIRWLFHPHGVDKEQQDYAVKRCRKGKPCYCRRDRGTESRRHATG
jgi:hypothetical protein